MDQFPDRQRVGAGATATVFRALCADTGRTVALKHFNRSCHMKTELDAYAAMGNHAGIPTDVKKLGNEPILIMEYMEMDLLEYIYRARPSPALVRSYMRQLLSVIAHAHDKAVIHGDIKPDNVLIDRVGNLKLVDWGLACFADDDIRTYGTRQYAAPEVLLGCRVTKAADVWSAGCIMVHMVTRAMAFDGHDENTVLLDIFKVLGTPDATTWSGIEDTPFFSRDWPRWNARPTCAAGFDDRGLIAALLTLDPARRITARAAMDHAYFQ